MTKVYRHPLEVTRRLRELGLDRSVLIHAVSAGLFAWRECTENDPKSYPGNTFWAATIRTLREGLLPLGWDRVDDHNLPLTVDRGPNIAITASSGDEYTGIAETAPKTRNPKGAVTKQKVRTNSEQLGFAFMTEGLQEEVVDSIDKFETWILLYYRDLRKGKLRCELSRPVGLDLEDRVSTWDERVLLEDIPFDTDSISLGDVGGDDDGLSDGPNDTDSGTDAINVEVKRRA